jgi:hypothetical protein
MKLVCLNYFLNILVCGDEEDVVLIDKKYRRLEGSSRWGRRKG